MKIDAHQHFWKLDRGDYDWLTPDLEVLYRDFLPEDLSFHLKEKQVHRTIAVQAAPTIAETEYLLWLYEKYDFIAGVVGWLDFEASNFQNQYKRYKNIKGFVGIRPMLQDIEDDQWILRPKVLKHIELLAHDGFPLDILIHPRHLPHITKLMREFPTLRAVINHIAKPAISSGITDFWKDYLKELAGYENVMCKLSGIITEAKQPFSIHGIKPFVQHVVEVFGTEAVMFGSDWPVCLLAGSYQDVYQVLIDCLPDSLTSSDLKKIFGENAMRFYRLKPRGDFNEAG